MSSINHSKDERIIAFKQYWDDHYCHISLELKDEEIAEFLEWFEDNIPKACDMASDYLLSQGLTEVQA